MSKIEAKRGERLKKEESGEKSQKLTSDTTLEV